MTAAEVSNLRGQRLDLQRERPIVGKVESEALQLVEIFDSLQGEGPDIGLPARFVRLAHCNRRCSWCDTDYAPRFELTVDEFVSRLAADYSGIGQDELALVIFTGGEPTLQARSLSAAIRLLEQNCPANWSWACESNGTLLSRPEVVEFYKKLHRMVVSPKPPSSENVPFEWPAFWADIETAGLAQNLTIKPVIADDTDLEWFVRAAEDASRPATVPFIMQTYVDPDPSTSALADMRGYWRGVLTTGFIAWMRRYNVRLLPRLHNLIWGNQQGY